MAAVVVECTNKSGCVPVEAPKKDNRRRCPASVSTVFVTLQAVTWGKLSCLLLLWALVFALFFALPVAKLPSLLLYLELLLLLPMCTSSEEDRTP